jgi:hypothetical protein
MPKHLQLVSMAAALVLAGSANLRAQRKLVAPPRPARPPIIQVQRPPQPTPQERRMLDLPSRWVERLQQMPPGQQQRFLNNNERFQSLPPQQQAQIRQRLQQFNRLTPEQQQEVIKRAQVWDAMSPQQQRYVRETLLPQWQTLPPRRRQVLLGKLHDLRNLSDPERAEKLNDEGFLDGLSPDERQMLRGLSNLRITGPEPPGDF